jgi:RNA polymerase sigma-70 factor (ECF subfamily)
VDRGDDVALAKEASKGDEQAFIDLVARHQGAFTRLALVWVGSPSIAEEVVQETWAVALEKLGEFEGRSSLKTWLCGILLNTARNRARKERRSVAVPSFEPDEAPDPAVPAERFSPAGHRWDGHWQAPPRAWPETPESALLSTETRGVVEACLDKLPEAQRAVLILRDVERLSGEEVCNALGITDTHQRVLLHRARSRMRALLEHHYDEKTARSSP